MLYRGGRRLRREGEVAVERDAPNLDAVPRPDAEPVPETTAAKRSRWAVVAAVLVVLAGGAGIAVLLGASAEETHAEAAHNPDVPHLDKDAIVVPAKFAARAGLVIEAVTEGKVSPEVRVVGQVSFDPAHVAAVGVRARGLIRKLAKVEGDAVRPEDLLAEVESTDLAAAQASLATSAAQLKAAERNDQRERQLFGDGVTTRRDVESAQANLAEQRAVNAASRQRVAALARGDDLPMGVYALRSPLEGTVIERHVHAGQSVEQDSMAFRVADLRYLWVELQVGDRFLHAVHKGDAVDIRPLSAPQLLEKGTIAYVGDLVDAATGMATVRVQVDNSDRQLRPGQSVTAIIRVGAGETPALQVPHAALVSVDGKPHVFVERGPGRVQPQAVTLGSDDGQKREVLTGLKPGDRVVVAGAFALKSELFR
jgi:cobalt-zinc-cadmium efflux system membrane fusion protein